jgi:hypothetical protein
MEEEQSLRQRRHPAKRQVATAQVGQFMIECQIQFDRAQLTGRRQQDGRLPWPDDVWRGDPFGHTQRGCAPQADLARLVVAAGTHRCIVKRH